MLTTAFRDTQLGNIGGFIGLITGITDFRAGTVAEANYTGYARVAVAWGAAADTSPIGGRQRANSGLATFPQNTGANQDSIAYGVYSLSTGGVLQAIGFLDTDPPIFGSGDATTNLITSVAHGLQTDQRVYVLAVPGAPIPTGLVENTAYFVLAAGLTADKFALSTTSGGAATDITVGGESLFMPYKVQTIASNATPEFAIGAIVVQM